MDFYFGLEQSTPTFIICTLAVVSAVSILSVGLCLGKKLLGKRSMDPESKRARLDEAEATSSTSNQVAPEPISESPLVESSAVASPGSDLFSGLPLLEDLPNLEPSPLIAQSLDQAPDPYLGDTTLYSIHTSAGETLYNLLQQAGIQAPQSWTMTELAAEVIDAEGDITYASEVLQDLLTQQGNSFYFEQTVAFVSLFSENFW